MTETKQKSSSCISSALVITYGIVIWAGALLIQETHRNVTSVYRLSALRVASAYRTVSKEASAAIAGLIPIEVLADERKRMYQRGKKANINAEQMKDEERQASLLRWQEEWDKDGNRRWTYRPIRHLDKWILEAEGTRFMNIWS